MLGEVERVEMANVARSGHRIAHKPYMRDHETQIVFRALRQKIRVLLSESATVAVCAAAPGEGASWAATMLACATAEDGGTVLLVDADVQKATQKSSFEIIGERSKRLPPALEAHFQLYGTSSEQISRVEPIRGQRLFPTRHGRLIAFGVVSNAVSVEQHYCRLSTDSCFRAVGGCCALRRWRNSGR